MLTSTERQCVVYSINERTKHFFIKIYLSFYSRKGPQFVVGLRDRWRDIYSERGLLLVPYLLLGARGCQHLHPLASRLVRDASALLRVPGSTPDSLHPLNLTAWLSQGLLPVTHLLTALTRCHLPVYLSQRDSLSKHTGSLGTNRKSMSYVI